LDHDFICNRYNFEELIQTLSDKKQLEKVIVDQKTGIEFYIKSQVSVEDFIEFLLVFSTIDNLVVQKTKRDYENNGQLPIRNYLFEVSWADVFENHVVIDYCGIYVNSSFDVEFIKRDGMWMIKK
jgi:hypothetical protein